MKICVSEEEEHVAKIRAALKENGGYCPCRLIKTSETKCPCQEFRAQSEPGMCHCGLYYKVPDGI